MLNPRSADPGAAAAAPRRTGDTVAIGGDYQYRAVTQGPRVQRFWHDTKRWLARNYLRPGPNDRLIDVGCGSGVVSDDLADAGAREVVGVDGSASAVGFASRQFQRPNLRFVRGLVDELAFPDASFDGGVCFELIEHIHLDQGQALLRSLHRIVRPGGRLLLTTPNYRSAWPVIEWALDRSGKVPKLVGDQHVTFFHHRMLRDLARRSGWRTVHQHTCCTLAPWVAALSWSLAERIRRVEGRVPFGTLLVHLLERPADTAGSKARAA